MEGTLPQLNMLPMRSSLFWNITQRWLIVDYRRFGDNVSVNSSFPEIHTFHLPTDAHLLKW